jgi:nucleotide-binding universal stress UspA family protein
VPKVPAVAVTLVGVIERVVVPVDFTGPSDRALVVAAPLAARAGATLDLIRVVALGEAAEAEPALAELAARIGGGTSWRVVESSETVAEALVAELRRGHSELWCVGSRAKGPVGEIIWGSTSQELVRAAHAPVVLVGPHVEEMRPLAVMAVAVDGSEESEAILPVAADLAQGLNIALQLVQVGEAPSAPLSDDVVETAYLISAAGRVPTVPAASVEFDFLHGHDVASSMAAYVAGYHGISLVAMTTRGLRGRARLVHPSTAFDLARESPVPVVILHPA